jgi:NADH:ubiquinone oxidoreductase subunit F (NADH-binding)/(2Fe-2S) ferredoxin/Pyruvate/2-oxoacid:ferredoxin oxidoreductase delta subunit
MNNSQVKYIFIGSRKDNTIYDSFVREAINKNLMNQVEIKPMSTFGLDSSENIVKIEPEGVVYSNVQDLDIEEILEKHTKNQGVVDRLLYKNPEMDFLKNLSDPYYHKQYRIVLKNSGVIDPESLDDYVNRKGYQGLAKALTFDSTEKVIDELKVSGLRGRGGGGFPTWMKWNFCKQVESDQKYVICNADEGDPGAYMDRSVLEGDPHALLEGMAICGLTVGASQGYIYCRAEYPLAIKRLEKAIKDATEAGLLGKNILGTGFSFDIEVRLGAGAFVCGEETALIASIEGERGMPRPRPPYPATKGLWGKPTNINNVETYANVPVILLKGGKFYGDIGTNESKGTKVFALTGKVERCGLVEVPMGTKIKDIVYDIGGGILDGKEFKAVQTGGPSGGVIPQNFLDTAISYESLKELDSIMGSGGMIVMDHTDCMIDAAKFYLQFAVDESCGKCSPCRVGTKQLRNLLDDISKGKANVGTMILINRICQSMQKASLCGLGQSAPNPVLSTMKYFKDEYIEHIVEGSCKTQMCKDLVSYEVIADKCIGCTACARKCPVHCISGGRKEVHLIDQSQCIKCGECAKACKFDAILVK